MVQKPKNKSNKQKFFHTQKILDSEENTDKNSEKKESKIPIWIFNQKRFLSTKTLYENFFSESLYKKVKILNQKNSKKKMELNSFFWKKFITRKLLDFFFKNLRSRTGYKTYIEEIISRCSLTRKKFSISFQNLITMDPLLALWVVEEPEKVIKICKKICLNLILDIFPSLIKKLNEIIVVITEIPNHDLIQQLNKKKIGCLVKTKGIVISKTPISPGFNLFKLICLKCIQLQKKIFSATYNWKTVFFICFNCKSTGPFQVCWYKVVRNSFQKIIIQEASVELDVKNMPFTKEVILKSYLIDSVYLGQEIFVSGILKNKYTPPCKFLGEKCKLFTFIEANHIQVSPSKKLTFFFSEKDERKIKTISKEGWMLFSLVFSILPSILGNQRLKLSLLLSVFSTNLNIEDEGKLNILIIGDPKVGKTQILKQIETVIPCSQYLTIPEIQKKFSFVLDNLNPLKKVQNSSKKALIPEKKEILLIDEMEYLTFRDPIILNQEKKKDIEFFRPNNREGMFGKKFNIIGSSKPFNNYYNPNVNSLENTNLEKAMFSSFDLVCLVRDPFNPSFDNFLGKKILDSHFRRSSRQISKISQKLPVFQFKFLKKLGFDPKKNFLKKILFQKFYFYAKTFSKPKIGFINQELISSLYISFRKEKFLKKGIPISSKNLESLFRIVTVSARIHLREKSTNEDLTIAIMVFFSSFLECQPREIGEFLKKKLEKMIIPFAEQFPKILFFF